MAKKNRGGKRMGRFVRFGKFSQDGVSLNYFKLTLQENQDITYFMESGMPMLEAIAKSVKNYETRDIFEDGISVFKADAAGMPIIENLQQLNSLYQRMGQEAFTINGNATSKGADGEPLVNVKSATQKEIGSQEIRDAITNTLKSKYRNVEDEPGVPDNITSSFVIFNQKKYTKPIKSWNTGIGANAHSSSDSGLRLEGGPVTKTIQIKDAATNVTKFTSKNGNKMVRYTYDGKERTDTEAKFKSRTETKYVNEPYRIVKKKKKQAR